MQSAAARPYPLLLACFVLLVSLWIPSAQAAITDGNLSVTHGVDFYLPPDICYMCGEGTGGYAPMVDRGDGNLSGYTGLVLAKLTGDILEVQVIQDGLMSGPFPPGLFFYARITDPTVTFISAEVLNGSLGAADVVINQRPSFFPWASGNDTEGVWINLMHMVGDTVSIRISTVPEPSTTLMFMLGIGILVIFVRRRAR